jgi:hypothetical protein
LRLPAPGEVRVVYVTPAQLPKLDAIPFGMAGGHLRLPGSGVNDDSNDVAKPLVDEFLSRTFTAYRNGRATLWLAREDLDTTATLAQAIGAIVRVAKRQLPEQAPCLLFVNADHFARQLGLDWDPSRPPYPVPNDDAERLAVLGRNRILFATDPRQGSVADLDLSVDVTGSLSVDLDRADTFNRLPKHPKMYVLTLTLHDEAKLTCATLGMAVGQIVKAAERSLDKSPAAQLPTTRPTRAQLDTITRLLGELDAHDWQQRDAARRKLIGIGPAAIDPLRQARPKQSPEAQQGIDLVLQAYQADFGKQCSMVLYIKSPALIAEIKKVRAATTRPAGQ